MTRTNTAIIGLTCKIIMPLAQPDVAIGKTRVNAYLRIQSPRAETQ
jgi:hypothetical protein